MGYRSLLCVFALSLLCSCAAFDNGGGAIEGFGDQDVAGNPTVTKETGANTGYFSGAMTLDTNTCQSVSDKAGVESSIAFDVVHEGNIVNATFEDGSTSASELMDTKATFLVETMGVKHVYYITFGAEGAVDGKCEVIEANAEGQYGEPCANYTLIMQKGEKPAKEEKPAEEEKK